MTEPIEAQRHINPSILPLSNSSTHSTPKTGSVEIKSMVPTHSDKHGNSVSKTPPESPNSRHGTILTNQDLEALKENRRGILCCCDKEVFVHRFTLCMLVVDICMLGLMSTLYGELIFLGPEDIDAFMFLYKTNRVSQRQQELVVRRFCILMTPIYFLLWTKVFSGIIMFYQRMKKGAFLRYYVISWSFYWSFTTQMAFILFASWQILKPLWAVLILVGLICTLPAWIIMNMHNKLIKEQSFELITQMKEGKSVTSKTREFLEIRQKLLLQNNNSHDIYSLPGNNSKDKDLSVVTEEPSQQSGRTEVPRRKLLATTDNNFNDDHSDQEDFNIKQKQKRTLTESSRKKTNMKYDPKDEKLRDAVPKKPKRVEIEPSSAPQLSDHLRKSQIDELGVHPLMRDTKYKFSKKDEPKVSPRDRTY